MTEDSRPSASGAAESCSSKPEPSGDTLSSQRVFKKSSPNNKLTLYLSSRDLVVSSGKIDKLQGVMLVDPEFVEDRKVYGQITLTFRYGREDEEVMGLKFCNEAVMCLAQLYPVHPSAEPEGVTPLQEALIKRLGPNAYPFNMEITPLAPPSVQLVPAKEYCGAPIGTSYDVRAYVAERPDEKYQRRTTVRMGIRVVQRAFAPPSPYDYNPCGQGKERSKHKITLFGCKSAPLESSKIFGQQMQQTKSKSVDVAFDVDKGCPKAGDKTERLAGGANDVEHKSPSKVTFQATGDVDIETNHRTEPDNSKPEEHLEKSDDACENDSSQIEQIKATSCDARRLSFATFLAEIPAPHATVEKQFLLSDGRIELEASLDKAIYHHGEEIDVTIEVQNNSNKTIRRIKVFVVQHVDVCMFSNGKFKNVVALINSKEDCPLASGKKLNRSYSLIPIKSSTKNWIALEDSYTKTGTSLASSVTSYGNSPEERNVFAIYVSYYVKVKLILSVMGGEVALKLPFTLMHSTHDFDPADTLTRVEPPQIRLELKTPTDEDLKPEKDGT